jgi:Na+/H+-dicarboxylate symporter
MAPALTAVHLPLEGIGILLAVDAIPDMFRTTANVTGTLALTAVLRDQTAAAPVARTVL